MFVLPSPLHLMVTDTSAFFESIGAMLSDGRGTPEPTFSCIRGRTGARSSGFCSMTLTFPGYPASSVQHHRRSTGKEDLDKRASSGSNGVPFGAVVPSASGVLLRRHGLSAGGWNSGSTFAHLQEGVAAFAAAGIVVAAQVLLALSWEH